MGVLVFTKTPFHIIILNSQALFLRPKLKEDVTNMARIKQSMDGNTAAAHVAYAFTEVAGI